MQKFKEIFMHIVFLLAAFVSIAAVLLICVFLFASGIPAMKEIGLTDFLFGKVWRPTNDYFGILPFILGSIYVTAGAIVIGVPIGLLTAIFLSKFCPPKAYKVIKPFINLMAGIRIFWNVCTCSGSQTDFRSERKYNAYRICTAWHHDTSDDHQCI